MNELDWILLVVMGVFTVVGLFRGLIRLVFTVLSVVVAIVLAGRSTGAGTTLMGRFVDSPAVAAVAAFLLVFIIVLVVMAIVGRLLTKAVNVLGLGWIDRLGGAVFGLATALLVAGATFLLLDLGGLEGHRLVRESTVAPIGWSVADGLRGVFPKGVRDKIQERGKQLKGATKAVERGREQMEELSEEVEKLSEKVTED